MNGKDLNVASPKRDPGDIPQIKDRLYLLRDRAHQLLGMTEALETSVLGPHPTSGSGNATPTDPSLEGTVTEIEDVLQAVISNVNNLVERIG